MQSVPRVSLVTQQTGPQTRRILRRTNSIVVRAVTPAQASRRRRAPSVLLEARTLLVIQLLPHGKAKLGMIGLTQTPSYLARF